MSLIFSKKPNKLFTPLPLEGQERDLKVILLMMLTSKSIVEYFHDQEYKNTIQQLMVKYKNKKSPKWLEVGIEVNNLVESLNFLNKRQPPKLDNLFKLIPKTEYNDPNLIKDLPVED